MYGMKKVNEDGVCIGGCIHSKGMFFINVFMYPHTYCLFNIYMQVLMAFETHCWKQSPDEGSMCNQYLMEEASHFVSHYFKPKVRFRYMDLPIHDDSSDNNDRSGVH